MGGLNLCRDNELSAEQIATITTNRIISTVNNNTKIIKHHVCFYLCTDAFMKHSSRFAMTMSAE